MTAVLGPSFGDAALHAAMGDFVVMQRDAAVALSGPPVIQGGDRRGRRRRGARRARRSRTRPAAACTSSSTARPRRSTRSPLPLLHARLGRAARAGRAAAPSPRATPRSCATLVPREPRRGYDMRKVLECIVDEDSLFQWGERFGRSLIMRARADRGPGRSASSPASRCSAPACSTCPALSKEARFVELCDTFNLPLVFLQDVPGLMIGTDAERGGILRRLRERRHARSPARRVPKIAVVVRKAYGGGHIALGGRPVQPGPAVRLAERRDGLHGARHRRPHRLPPAAGARCAAEEGSEAHDALVGRARGRVGGRVRSRGRRRPTSSSTT